MRDSNSLSVAGDAWLAQRAGLAAILERQHKRLQDLVTYARQNSRFYAGKYADLPTHIHNVRQLPPASKPELMGRFEDWVTDPEIKRADIDAFVADKSKIGELFRDQYLVFTTSGSTGTPAILVQDNHAQVVMTGLTYVRGLGTVSLRQYWQVLRKGGRQVALFATGGHFLGVTMISRRQRSKPWRAKISRIISVLTPLPEIVRQLNQFQPAMVGGYATMLAVLAEERLAGRLQITPVLITSSGETLSAEGRRQIEAAFGCAVTESYGCSEATPLTLSCRHQRLHVNADWFILEAVDEQYRPVVPGQHSHTVLLSNLANHVQPIIRYELGDSIAFDPEPCPCGSPLPTVRVIGRTDDILAFQSKSGVAVQVLPLALWSIVKETPGVLRFQAVQTAPTQLNIRLETCAGGDPEAIWRLVKARVREFFATLALTDVLIERSPQPPQRDPRSGKFKHVWSEI